VNSLPSKQELLAFQARWLRPAGIAAVLGSLMFAAGVVVQQAGLDATDNDFEQLQQVHDHSGQLIAGQAIQGFGFILFTPLIYVLFRAAAGRTERTRRSLLPLALIGPPIFFAGAVVASLGLKDAADQFVEERPAIERQARAEAAADQTNRPNQTGQGAKQGAGHNQPGAEGEIATSATTTATTTTRGGNDTETTEERVDDALEERAEDLASDSSGVQVGSGLRLTATLALVFALVYVPLWAMRTGLLRRFWATLGMALGASLILVGLFGLMGLVLWFAAIGLQLAGWWPGARPPAWDAGEAVPWPKPGEPVGPPPSGPPGGPGGTVEGSGREVSEAPLPEDGPTEPTGETQGQRRKKRKRRG
jgi:hypothetical protein